MPSKKCSKCNIEKDVSEFNKSNRPRDKGCVSRCRDCLKIDRNLNREKIKGYYRRTRDHSTQKAREHYAQNREQCIERVKKYHRTPQGKLVESRASHRRRSLSEHVDCSLTLEQWNKIIFMQDNLCATCGKKFSSKCKPTKDHIIPLSKGGGLTFENIQALCASCNSRKNDKIDTSKITTWIMTPDDFKPDCISRRSKAKKKYWSNPNNREKQMIIKIKSFLDRQWYGSVKYRERYMRLRGDPHAWEIIITNNPQQMEGVT